MKAYAMRLGEHYYGFIQTLNGPWSRLDGYHDTKADAETWLKGYAFTVIERPTNGPRN